MSSTETVGPKVNGEFGPWMVRKYSLNQPDGRNYYVTRSAARKHPEGAEWADVEWLRDSNGAQLRFLSNDDAESAIADAMLAARKQPTERTT